jgi:hypothetical protein
MLLFKAGVDFENVNHTPETFQALKDAGSLEYNQMPMVELDDGTKLVQS